MEIKFIGKKDASHRDNLIVQYVDILNERPNKVTLSVAAGQTIEVPDDIAHEILAKYRGCFEIQANRVSGKAKNYASKSKTGYNNKAAEASHDVI